MTTPQGNEAPHHQWQLRLLRPGRQWLWRSAEIELVKSVSAGRLTIGRAVELLELTYYDIYRIAQENNIVLGASDEIRAIGRSLVGDSLKPRESLNSD